MSKGAELLSPVWTHLTTMQPVRAEGVYFYDAEGNRWIDFTSGIGVINTGHRHPKVVAAIQEALETLLFAQMNIVINPRFVELAEKLNEVTPLELDRFFFSNSGAEAVEAAVKLARHATRRRNIIVFQGSFHGRTAQTMAMTTSKYIYRYDYQPLPGGVFVSPFPYAYHYGWDEETTTAFCLKELDHVLHGQSAPDETAAFIIEPVLGEGGYVPAPPAFLEGLRQIADDHGILLVMDEVQSGFGRTGKFFCYQHADVIPDIIIMAKGLGSGMPISGIAASADLMAKWRPGAHGGTYGGGNALAAAAASATIDVIREEKLAENAALRGSHLMARLVELQAQFPVIGDVRGRGLMVATEFTDEHGRPDPDTAKAVAQAALEDRLMLLTCGAYGNVIRWIPPLIVTDEQIDEALDIFARALASVVSN